MEVKFPKTQYIAAKIAVFLFGLCLFLGAALSTAGASAGTAVEAGNKKDLNLTLTSGKDSYRIDESPDFEFKLSEKRNFLASLFAWIKDLLGDEYQDADIEAWLTCRDGADCGKLALEAHYLKDGRFKIMMPENGNGLKPGKYTLQVTASKPDGKNEKAAYSQDFTWGVLAINTDKSAYLPGETARLSMAVLDDKGDTICGAGLKLVIEAPDGGAAEMSTDNGLIALNRECGINNVIDSPDYSAVYGLSGCGSYKIKLTAATKNGVREITDQFEVKAYLPFEIERSGPTRIYPLANYKMAIRIKANEDYQGEFREYVPNSFGILDSGSQRHEHDFKKNTRAIIWDLELKQGEIREISYIFDAPDVFPMLFLLGKARIGNFEEFRFWQVASDATGIYDADNGASTGWTNALRAWDSLDGQYANRNIPGSSADDSANYLLATSTKATSTLAKITSAYIGIEGYVQNTAVSAMLQPVFGGITNGETYEVGGTLLGTGDSNNNFWKNITNDASGPGTGNWTWSDLQALDVRVFGLNIGGPSRNLYIDQIRISADYDFYPSGVINSAMQKSDGSGAVDISIDVNDTEATSTATAKIEFATSSACVFTIPGKAEIDPSPESITADSGTPAVDNGRDYQVGTPSGWITTVGGSNTVDFDWLTKNNIPDADGTYCIRVTASDLLSDQAVSATATLIIDNASPGMPGRLTSTSSSATTIRLAFGATSTETHFKEYKIYYKPYDGTPVTESDLLHSSSTDSNLGFIDFYGATSTLIYSLSASTTYSFNIWAYDSYGNKSSSTQIDANTTIRATWREGEDTIDPTKAVPLGKDKNIRLRLAITNEGDWAASSTSFQLEYGIKNTDCSEVSEWTAITDEPSSRSFVISSSQYMDDGDSIHPWLSNTEAYSYASGSVISLPSATSSTLDLPGGSYTELEYVLKATAAAQASTTYCFRAKNGDNILDAYDVYPELTLGPAPSSHFNSIVQKADGSGSVDINIGASDIKQYDSRLKIEYAAGLDCIFMPPLKPLLDEAGENISALYGNPRIDNGHPYQVGTSSGMIITFNGENTLGFDWLSKNDIGEVENSYCLRMTANDGFDDQIIPAMATVAIDNLPPSEPGYLAEAGKTDNSITLKLGTSTFDNNFKEYKIFYKEGISGVSEESGLLHSSSTDINLGNEGYNGATTTVIGGLLPYRYYVFNIWAYDEFGNKASSSQELAVSFYYTPKSGNWRWYYDEFLETPTSTAASENNTPFNIVSGSTVKLRMSIKEINGITGDNVKMRLQYSTMPDFSSGTDFIGENASTSHIWIYGNGVDNDDDPILNKLLSDSITAARHNESGIATSSYGHEGNDIAEWEFTIKNNGALPSVNYYFRAWDSVNNREVETDIDKTYPSLVTQTGEITYSLVGVGAGITTEGVTTNITTTAHEVPFGYMLDTESIGAYRFDISTNAGSGYYIYVRQTDNLKSNNGHIINPIPYTNEEPDIWPLSANPSNFGYHTGDNTLSGPSPSRFLQDNMYAKFENTMKEIGFSPIPIENDIFDLIFRSKTTSMQPAGDYRTEIHYVLVPVY